MLFVLFALVATLNGDSCDSSCQFIFDNRTGGAMSNTLYAGEAGQLRGVISIKGTFDSTDCVIGLNLKLRNVAHSGLIYRPFAFSLYPNDNKADVYGEFLWGPGESAADFRQLVKGWMNAKSLDIQISDAHIGEPSGYYDIYLNRKNVRFSYKTEPTARLSSVNGIISDRLCISYSYIMMCDNAKPKVCELSGPSGTLSLGESYTLTCRAAGAPLLEIFWTTPEGKELSGTQTLNTGHDIITSTLVIQPFTAGDSGTYTCTIRNTNYRDSASRTFTLSYKQEYIIRPPPEDSFNYRPSSKVFIWGVTGWPLEAVVMHCDTGSVTSKILRREAKKVFTIRTLEQTKPYTISCSFFNGDSSIAILIF